MTRMVEVFTDEQENALHFDRGEPGRTRHGHGEKRPAFAPVALLSIEREGLPRHFV